MLWLEASLRSGVIPLCCGGASGCFALYATKVHLASREWSLLAASVPPDEGTPYAVHSRRLGEHGGTCAALSITSAATAGEAVRDWRGYRSLPSPVCIGEFLIARPLPFFLRWTVLMTVTASLLATERITGGIRMWQPRVPLVVPVQTSREVIHRGR